MGNVEPLMDDDDDQSKKKKALKHLCWHRNSQYNLSVISNEYEHFSAKNACMVAPSF